jgi:small-conductance mechanosensitive channel
MKKQEVLSFSAVILGLIFTIGIVFAVVQTSANERFPVEQFKKVVRPGYETAPAATAIHISPSLAWDKTPGFPKALGVIFLVAMWIGIYVVSADRHLSKKEKAADKENIFVALLLTFGPLILSAVCFFGWYSGKFANNYVAIEKQRFDNLVNTGAIEKKGEKTYVYKSDSLKTLFLNKEIIN